MSIKGVIISVLLAAGLACAAAQGCPSKICEAKFDNAYPAPTDCCVHDYKANPKCQWGGTPVSWRQTRTCSSGGKTYSVLVENNAQGPGISNECRCGNTVVTSGGQTTPQLKPQADKDISGSDIACNGQKFCKVCGGLDSVRGACAGKAQCVAFTYNSLESCGYLKTGSKLVSRTGWVSYVRT